nr:hypothetical protein [Tanacetum cinerariifolium]
LGEAATRTRGTTLGGGLKYSLNIGWKKISQLFFIGGTEGVEEGGFCTSPEQIVPGSVS